jgi:hypothetical protein
MKQLTVDFRRPHAHNHSDSRNGRQNFGQSRRFFEFVQRDLGSCQACQLRKSFLRDQHRQSFTERFFRKLFHRRLDSSLIRLRCR